MNILQVTTLTEETDGGDDNGDLMGDLLSEFSGEGFDGSGSGDFDTGSGLGEFNGSGEEEEGGDEDAADPFEFVEVSTWWVAPLMRFMSIVHSVISLAMLVAYYHLKVRQKISKFFSQIRVNRTYVKLTISGSIGHFQEGEGNCPNGRVRRTVHRRAASRLRIQRQLGQTGHKSQILPRQLLGQVHKEEG